MENLNLEYTYILIFIGTKSYFLKNQNLPKLQNGDEIVLISTARKVAPEEIKSAVEIIEKWGLKVSLGSHLFKEDHQFSGTVKQRTEDLQNALDHKEVKAIFFVRGGYGSIQVLDQIQWKGFLEAPKWLIGFSDVTVFHAHVNENFKIPTLHAAMPITFPNNSSAAINQIRDLLFGHEVTYEIDAHPLNRKGKAEAEVVGGNLSILYSLLGSESQLNTRGKILFIEDLDEYLYHIDRMMQALKRAGMLSELSGLIVGGMTDMNDNKIPFGKGAEEIIRDVVSEFNYPIAFGFPAGHITNNKPLLFGQKKTLHVSDKVKLI